MLRQLFNWLSQYLQGSSSRGEEFTGEGLSLRQLKKEGVIEDNDQYTPPDTRPSYYGETP